MKSLKKTKTLVTNWGTNNTFLANGCEKSGGFFTKIHISLINL
jgi:hypothetical protein